MVRELSKKRGDDRRRQPLEPRSLEREVYETLRDEILTGIVAPGQPLIEAQLAVELGVSKTPVREALIRLQRDGLVEIRPYRGARVRRPSSEDVVQAVEARMWVETQVARALATKPSAELLEQLQRNIEATQAALDADDYERFVRTVRGFSELLLKAHGNRYAMQVVESLYNILALIGSAFRRAPGRKQESIDEHWAILAALAAHDPDAADAATRRHLESIKRGAIEALSEGAASARAASASE
jgi:DNA-binding GntR family transcriptional regulator